MSNALLAIYSFTGSLAVIYSCFNFWYCAPSARPDNCNANGLDGSNCTLPSLSTPFINLDLLCWPENKAFLL